MIDNWMDKFSYMVKINNESENIEINIHFTDNLSEDKLEDIIYYIESWFEVATNDAYGLGTINWMSEIKYNKNDYIITFEVDMSSSLNTILGILFYILDQSINIKPLILGKKNGEFVKISIIEIK